MPAYGAVRFVLDAWEGYLGHQVAWYDPSDGFVVELVPQVDWDISITCQYLAQDIVTEPIKVEGGHVRVPSWRATL